MAAAQHVGAAAPGLVTPIRDEALALAGDEGFRGDETEQSRKHTDAATADQVRIAAFKAIRAQHQGLATSTQRACLLEALQALGHVTTFEASRYLDLYDPRARKMELVKAGHRILTAWRQVPTESGKCHRIGVYMLVKGADFRQQPEQAAEARCKRLETLRARLALRGYELRELDRGALLVARWSMSRELASLDAAEAFAGQVGA